MNSITRKINVMIKKSEILNNTLLLNFFIITLLICNNILMAHSIKLDQYIILNKKKYFVEELLDELTTNYSLSFSYNDKEINLKYQIEFKHQKYILKELIKEIEEKTDLSFSIYEDIIIIKKKPALKKYTISGYVEDAGSGERLINASVYDTLIFEGTITNEYGFYSITLPAGTNVINFSFIGYNTKKIALNLNNDTTINIALKPSLEIKEVVIIRNKDQMVEKETPGLVKFPVKNIQKLPSLIGEPDIIKTLHLLPGITSGSEGRSYMYVRGGNADQNLILLDEVPVYNANHLFGFFSVFNTDAIRSVKLYKGGFPSQYGGRLSSVLDIRMKEGNSKKYTGQFGIGLMSSRLTFEGPIKKDKSSFIISARRTYFDLITKSLFDKNLDLDLQKAYFHDITGKIHTEINPKNHLYFSIYLGKDQFSSNDNNEYRDYNEGMIWGNTITSVRWNCVLSNKLFTNTTISYANYEFKYYNKSQSESEESWDDFVTSINDKAIKTDFDFSLNPRNQIKFGYGYIYHTFNPWQQSENYYGKFIDWGYNYSLKQKLIYTHELYTYIGDNLKLSDKINTQIGIHYSNSFVQSKYYHSLQPRISSAIEVTKKSTLTISYTNMTQYMQLFPANNYYSVTDLWLPVTKQIKPVTSQQYTTGVNYDLNSKVMISVEGFYKKLNNVAQFVDSSYYVSESQNWEDLVETGVGWSYGTEFLIQKHYGKLTGWLSYTLSWSKRKFNDGKVIPYKYDRRHDLNFVTSYQFNDRMDIGLMWIYTSGYNMTIPSSKYPSLFSFSINNNDIDINRYESRNNFKTPNYHRLDFSFNFYKVTKRGKHTFTIGIYNTYSRKNPFHIYVVKDENGNTRLQSMCILPLAPELRYNFKF